VGEAQSDEVAGQPQCSGGLLEHGGADGERSPDMWWWVLGIIAVIVLVFLVERRRGSTGASREEDRHLNNPDIRGGGGF
jgi:hypothetical protein